MLASALLLMSQVGPFEAGQVKAHMEHGLGCTEIQKRLVKANGKTPFGEAAIVRCMNKIKADASWRGQRQKGSGAPRKTTAKQDRQVIRWCLANRGKEKVNVPKLKQKFPYLRKLGDSLVEERLHDADLEWLRRRRKYIVEKQYLQPRINYCRGVKRMHTSTLEKWAYTDGTVYYLDRNEAEHEHSVRASLGTHVWRMSDNSDAMYEDCIGPSNYNKGQGIPVKVWGFLACGVLHIHILEEGETMDMYLYSELIDDKFEGWAGNCDLLVCDYESCLRGEMALDSLEKIGMKLVEDYPVHSQDFNAMENAWKTLKDRLDETLPVKNEGREAFIKRLHAAVKWANRSRAKQLWSLSTNQKQRAADCLAAKPPGGRTKW